ncbi:unnamed protein product, partial [Iphiclides podalirius]
MPLQNDLFDYLATDDRSTKRNQHHQHQTTTRHQTFGALLLARGGTRGRAASLAHHSPDKVFNEAIDREERGVAQPLVGVDARQRQLGRGVVRPHRVHRVRGGALPAAGAAAAAAARAVRRRRPRGALSASQLATAACLPPPAAGRRGDYRSSLRYTRLRGPPAHTSSMRNARYTTRKNHGQNRYMHTDIVRGGERCDVTGDVESYSVPAAVRCCACGGACVCRRGGTVTGRARAACSTPARPGVRSPHHL